MGKIMELKVKWKCKSVAEKIGTVLDIIAKVGGGLIGSDLGRQFGQGHGIVGRVCISITTAGVGVAVGDVASKALYESYAEPIGKLADTIKEKREAATHA